MTLRTMVVRLMVMTGLVLGFFAVRSSPVKANNGCTGCCVMDDGYTCCYVDYGHFYHCNPDEGFGCGQSGDTCS